MQEQEGFFKRFTLDADKQIYMDILMPEQMTLEVRVVRTGMDGGYDLTHDVMAALGDGDLSDIDRLVLFAFEAYRNKYAQHPEVLGRIIYGKDKNDCARHEHKNDGYAIFENSILINHGVLYVDKQIPVGTRTDEMMRKLHDFIADEHPDIIIVEMTVVPTNVTTQRELTELIGAVRGICAAQGIDFHRLRPSEWRKLVCADGEKHPVARAEVKQWSVAKVKNLYGLETEDDESDAVLIGQAYVNLIQNSLIG